MAWTDGDLSEAFETWLSECRQAMERYGGVVPYVNNIRLLMRNFEGRLLEASTEDAAELIKRYAANSDGNPGGLMVRGALLAFLYDRYLTNQNRGVEWRNEKTSSQFLQIAGRCQPEVLGDRASLLFELHNCYLALNWELAKQLFKRIREVGVYSDGEAHAVEGHFWFLSVLGPRILREFSEGHEFVYGFHWVETLPSEFNNPRARDDRMRSTSFLYPELLTPGSPAHWILTAWCSNPRIPAMCDDPVTLERLDFSKVEIEEARYLSALDDDFDLHKYRTDRFNLLYRNFEPLRPLVLQPDEKERLQQARDCLLNAFEAAPALAQPYEVVLANVLFHLGDFDRAYLFFGKSNARDFKFENIWSEYYGGQDSLRFHQL
jgi:hypothetical protein